MHDESALEQNVDALVKQIMLALVPDEGHEKEDEMVEGAHEPDVLFTAEELRNELDRLRQGESTDSKVRRILRLDHVCPADHQRCHSR